MMMCTRVYSWKTYILRESSFLNCRIQQNRFMRLALTSKVGRQWSRKGERITVTLSNKGYKTVYRACYTNLRV